MSSIAFFLLSSCASVSPPEEHHARHSFPASNVFVDLPIGSQLGKPYEILGWVRSKTNWPTMEQDTYSEGLCRNYYNKAAYLLLKEAKKVGADAVIQVRSVVFMLDGKMSEFSTPECSDDGAEGEILLRGIAIKYKPLEEKSKSAQ